MREIEQIASKQYLQSFFCQLKCKKTKVLKWYSISFSIIYIKYVYIGQNEKNNKKKFENNKNVIDKKYIFEHNPIAQWTF